MSKEQPRGRKERFIVIPFSTCRSASSVDVVQSNKPQAQGRGGGEVTSAPAVVGKPSKGESLSLVARLLRGFKNLSHQIFAVYDEEDGEEEEEQEMVIGLPTDVKHVAHIGWDGSTSTTTSLCSWNRAAPPPPADAASTSSSSSAAAPLPLPPASQAQEPALSVRQFELAIAAQASAAGASTATAVAGAASTSGSGAGSSTARRHRHYS